MGTKNSVWDCLNEKEKEAMVRDKYKIIKANIFNFIFKDIGSFISYF